MVRRRQRAIDCHGKQTPASLPVLLTADRVGNAAGAFRAVGVSVLRGVVETVLVQLQRPLPSPSDMAFLPSKRPFRRLSRGGITALFRALICAIFSARMTVWLCLIGLARKAGDFVQTGLL